MGNPDIYILAKYLTQENGQFGVTSKEQQQLCFEQEILAFRISNFDFQRGVVERHDLELQQLRAHHADCVGKLGKLQQQVLELEKLVAQQRQPDAKEPLGIEIELYDLLAQLPDHQAEVAIAVRDLEMHTALHNERHLPILEAITDALQNEMPSAQEVLDSLTLDVLIRRKL
jgi:hypothetical protein